MKAWIVGVEDQSGSTVVFAETRGKARAIAMHTDACEEADFTDIYVNRLKIADSQYKGKDEMDWDSTQDRIFLVKECGWSCDTSYVDINELYCGGCPAKEYCNAYNDLIKEREKE